MQKVNVRLAEVSLKALSDQVKNVSNLENCKGIKSLSQTQIFKPLYFLNLM